MDGPAITATMKSDILALLDDIGGWPLLNPQWKEFGSYEEYIADIHKKYDVPFLFRVGITPQASDSSKRQVDLEPQLITLDVTSMLEMAIKLGAAENPTLTAEIDKVSKHILLVHNQLLLNANESKTKNGPLDRLKGELPEFDLEKYITRLFDGVVPIKPDLHLKVRTIEYFKQIRTLFTNKRVFANYAAGNIVVNFFKQHLFNNEVSTVRTFKCLLDVTEKVLIMPTTQMYVTKYYPDRAAINAKLTEMLVVIKEVLTDMINKADWLDDDTRKSALKKLTHMDYSFVHPKNLFDDALLIEKDLIVVKRTILPISNCTKSANGIPLLLRKCKQQNRVQCIAHVNGQKSHRTALGETCSTKKCSDPDCKPLFFTYKLRTIMQVEDLFLPKFDLKTYLIEERIATGDVDKFNDDEDEEQFIWGNGQPEFVCDPLDVDVSKAIQGMRVDEEHSFKVIGEEKFIALKKIQLRPSWISAANVFDNELAADKLLPIKELTGLHPKLLKRVKKNISSYFPVQKAVLSHLLPLSTTVPILPARDIAVSAPTGSGKTLCYVLPILNSLQHSNPSSVFAVVVAPLVLLASQIAEEFKKYDPFGTKIVLLSNTQSYSAERHQLFPDNAETAQASIIVATPDRLVEHLTDVRGRIDLSQLRYLVIDEADRMKNVARMEWLSVLEDLADIRKSNAWSIARLHNSKQNRWIQKILVSATLHLDVERLFVWNLRCPRLFCSDNNDEKAKTKKVESVAKIAENVALPTTLLHKVVLCDASRKPLDVYCHIRENSDWQRVMIFVNNIVSGNRLTTLLQYMFKGNRQVAELSTGIYGSRRLKLLKRFASGAINVLVCSDSTGRGVDVADLDCVMNYDLPRDNRSFIHRAGRTARAGKDGVVLSFATKEEKVVFKKMLTQGHYWNNVVELPKTDLSSAKERALYKKGLEQLKKNCAPEDKE
uniref:ATP-dependent RNA helicase n=1 Tax=Panagrellus redivivus TaxID=6233 RepID=A0A7E4UNR6_PANRE